MQFREIQTEDNIQIANIIRQVMTEFGAVGPGFSIEDPEVDFMHQSYQGPRHAYFVCLKGGKVVGGSGIGPLLGGDHDVCELKKMYTLAKIRGLGVGKKLMELCLQTARQQGYKKCYIETLSGMNQAMKLYENNGFQKIKSPMGNTGHGGCDHYYLLQF
jgi:putative acetyltransferase